MKLKSGLAVYSRRLVVKKDSEQNIIIDTLKIMNINTSRKKVFNFFYFDYLPTHFDIVIKF